MGNAPDEDDERLGGTKGFLMWVVVVATGLVAYGVAYLSVAAAFGETPGYIAGIAALILASSAWVRWGPKLPDIPD